LIDSTSLLSKSLSKTCGWRLINFLLIETITLLIENKTDVKETLKLNILRKLKKNYQKIAKTRRQRGYQWENTLVK